MILRLCEGEPTSMRSVAAYAHYTYAQLAPPELQVTPKKESMKKGVPTLVCEQLNSRRTLTLPYPKFVGLKQPSEACLAFASSLLVVIRLLFRVYFCLFMFCFLYSLQLHFLVHSLKRKLMRMPKLSHSPSLSLPLVLSLSVGYRGSLALSSRTCPLCPQRQRRRTVFTFIVQLIRHLLLLSLLLLFLLLLLLLVC